MIFKVKITQGKYDLSEFKLELDNFLRNKDGTYLIEVKKQSAKRSNPQNNYYWGVVLETISEHTGHTTEELHEIFKRLFLTPQYLNYRGKEIKIPHTTTKLNKPEFSVYLERIFAEAGSMGISIPPPDTMNPY